MTTIRVDARRLLCPMPVIRTQDAAQSLNPGDVIEVLCTDPGASQDIPAWCRIHGHTVLSINHKDDQLTIVLEIGSPSV